MTFIKTTLMKSSTPVLKAVNKIANFLDFIPGNKKSDGVLEQIAQFLQDHPSEVIFLDLVHENGKTLTID